MSDAGMQDATSHNVPPGWLKQKPTAAIVLGDGTVLPGVGLGAHGHAVGELCFNTAMTGYQEILTDPSYSGQIITFTFPHIGIVGINDDDSETANPAGVSGVLGAVFRARVHAQSNYRATHQLNDWLTARGIIAISEIDTRALTHLIRTRGMPKAAITHNATGEFDFDHLAQLVNEWPGIEGKDLAGDITVSQPFSSNVTPWKWPLGFSQRETMKFRVVIIDYGSKSNILRELVGLGCDIHIVSAHASIDEILGLQPDGVVLSNGPGDPVATGSYALVTIRALLNAKMPIFGICLGHQLLALALGAKTKKMSFGHHGANHPVLDIATGKVEITSMNHGFTVDSQSLPAGVKETHRSLFDGTNCGVSAPEHNAFSIQHHPEASPGPHDSGHLFTQFLGAMEERQI